MGTRRRYHADILIAALLAATLAMSTAARGQLTVQRRESTCTALVYGSGAAPQTQEDHGTGAGFCDLGAFLVTDGTAGTHADVGGNQESTLTFTSNSLLLTAVGLQRAAVNSFNGSGEPLVGEATSRIALEFAVAGGQWTYQIDGVFFQYGTPGPTSSSFAELWNLDTSERVFDPVWPNEVYSTINGPLPAGHYQLNLSAEGAIAAADEATHSTLAGYHGVAFNVIAVPEPGVALGAMLTVAALLRRRLGGRSRGGSRGGFGAAQA